MCDTLVALGNSTADGKVLFAKNSDREPNEAHEVLILPAGQYPAGTTVHCTYVDVPQVRDTHAVLLAKPFWIWGAEMGANDCGVVIGNEAVFTRVAYEKKPGLIGMDFIRLGLERAASARQALNVIVELLETYGQGGNCGFQHEFYYHNSFLIADRQEAWVLETVGRLWAAEKVQDVRAISNALSIDTQYDLGSQNLADFARSRGWCKKGEEFSFRRAYSDFLYTRFSDAIRRRSCVTGNLHDMKGKITPQSIMGILRSHHEEEKRDWGLDLRITGADVCMHAGFGPVRGSQSTGSMVSCLGDGEPLHWVTATSAPCTSLFKPVWLDCGIGDTGPHPTGVYDNRSLWWQHELLHREVLKDYADRLNSFRDERDFIEASFLSEVSTVSSEVSDRKQMTVNHFQKAAEAEANWLNVVRTLKRNRTPAFYYRTTWDNFNQRAKIPVK